MAILCVATANFEKNYFQQVDRNLQARHYLLTHWEDFFKGYTLDAPSLTAVNITNSEGVIEDPRCQVGVGGQLGAAGAGDDPAMRKLAVPLAVVLSPIFPDRPARSTKYSAWGFPPSTSRGIHSRRMRMQASN